MFHFTEIECGGNCGALVSPSTNICDECLEWMALDSPSAL